MNGRWFWENRFMGWVESKLLSFTNWFWNKRHQPPLIKKEPQLESINENKKKSPAKKAPAKKTTTRKKTDWNVK
jgi:hypothetical protein